MLNQLKTSLSDATLQQKLRKATSLEESVTLIRTAGPKNGDQFSSADLSQLFQGLLNPIKLSETELLNVSGGRPTIVGCGPTQAVTWCGC
ncbi:hypothetical protein [Leptothoe spongobia]|uniref:Uncharacterized protein n=1 Tax=Leptothoe spongobia TAU-MAC 1115 TaxID=1967444 RepID=A0A947GJA9_9CYAN|nr:hypothetical protein [Leptothoe spongobia]MBT9315793.1 hypothetical protein [Leptothoe spongobia TAU-MAC 1115]